MSKKNTKKVDPTFVGNLKRPKTVAAHLDAAADYIEEYGWCSGDLKDADGRVCALGAINAVTVGEHSLRESVYCAYAKFLVEGKAEKVNPGHTGNYYPSNEASYKYARRANHQTEITSFNDAKSSKNGSKIVRRTLRQAADFIRKNS